MTSPLGSSHISTECSRPLTCSPPGGEGHFLCLMKFHSDLAETESVESLSPFSLLLQEVWQLAQTPEAPSGGFLSSPKELHQLMLH